MGKSSGECLVKTCDTYIDIFAHFSRCKYKCLYKCLCTQNCVQFSHTHNTYYIISFSFWLYMENKHKQQKIKKMCTNYQSDWPWTQTGYHFPLDVWWIYLGKWHNDRTLFSRTWKSWELDSGNHPQMAQQFRLVKYYFIYPEYMILWYLQLDGARVTNLRLPWAVLWWFSVELAEFPVFEKIPLTSWNGSKLQGDIGFILES